jgi:precorrin-8X/cobalt-precorrin-8 methylmutase
MPPALDDTVSDPVSKAPVFDAYVMVDWSAAAAPVRGADSTWVACLERRDGGLVEILHANPATRVEAAATLADLFSDLIARDRATLAGFDFAFGYPAGFARRLRPDAPDWRGVWKALTARVRDGADNRNNRFAVAAGLNERLCGRPFPFWGCPAGAASAYLSPRKPDGFDDGDGWREYRLTDRRINGPKSVWQMAYSGSVGGQTMLGIAALHGLRHHPWLVDVARIWPFETGLRPIERPQADGLRLVFAETWPSIVEVDPAPGEVRDAAQVRALAVHFARLDGSGRLGRLFAGPSDLTAEQRRQIETEEAWILGIETAGRPSAVALPSAGYDYLRDPQSIYRRSFELIRAEAGLDRLPEALRPVAERLVHAIADPAIVADLVFSPDLVVAAGAALRRGAPILVDSEMVAAGIIRSRLPAAAQVICTLAEVDGAAASAAGTTRSAAAVDRWLPHLAGAVVAIGNAPTALFRLLELLDAGAPRPAAVLGFPVGFVGAAEAKEALIVHSAGVPYLALRGRRGGSALAAAAVNGLAGVAR